MENKIQQYTKKDLLAMFSCNRAGNNFEKCYRMHNFELTEENKLNQDIIISLQFLRDSYIWECHWKNIEYYLSNQDIPSIPIYPTLTGWIKYWRKHQHLSIAYPSDYVTQTQ